MLYEQDMNEKAYCNGSGMDLWIGSDWIWYLELRMRSANIWDMTPMCAVTARISLYEQIGESMTLWSSLYKFSTTRSWWSCLTCTCYSILVAHHLSMWYALKMRQWQPSIWHSPVFLIFSLMKWSLFMDLKQFVNISSRAFFLKMLSLPFIWCQHWISNLCHPPI